MDHTHSELPPCDPFSGAMLAVINALRLVKDDPKLREAVQVLARNPQVQEAARGLSYFSPPLSPARLKKFIRRWTIHRSRWKATRLSSMRYSIRRLTRVDARWTQL